MSPIGVALLGYGLAGKVFHAPLIAHEPGLRLHSVVTSRAEEVAADHPGACILSSVAEAVADPEVGLVVVATPDALHAEHATAALEAGKAVVVDKPFAADLTEAHLLIELAAARGLLISVFQNRRWDADFLALRQVIDSGRLGRIVAVESRFDRFRPEISDAWKEGREGGVWRDLGPHLVDQMVQLFGAPGGVIADIAAVRDGADAPDYAHVLLDYADGPRVVLNMSKVVAASDLRFAVHGTRGSWVKLGLDTQEDRLKATGRIEAENWGADPLPAVFTEGSTGERSQLQGPAGDYPAYYRAIVRALAGEGANPVPPDQALSVMAVIDAGLRSNRLRREVAPDS